MGSQKLKLKTLWGRMKKNKAAGLTGVITEMLKTLQDTGVQWLTNLGNGIIDEGRIAGDLEKECSYSSL